MTTYIGKECPECGIPMDKNSKEGEEYCCNTACPNKKEEIVNFGVFVKFPDRVNAMYMNACTYTTYDQAAKKANELNIIQLSNKKCSKCVHFVVKSHRPEGYEVPDKYVNWRKYPHIHQRNINAHRINELYQKQDPLPKA